jgi:hypothetical protein
MVGGIDAECRITGTRVRMRHHLQSDPHELIQEEYDKEPEYAQKESHAKDSGYPFRR